MIVLVSVVLRRTICGDIDWCFDNLSRSHHHLTLMMTSAQVVETSVMYIIINSPSQDYTHPDNHTCNLLTYNTTLGFKSLLQSLSLVTNKYVKKLNSS